MKFLHTADLHLGASRKLNGYLKRQEQMLHEIYRVAEDNRVKTVLMLGDLFHRKDIKHEERDLLLRTLLKYDRLGYTTLIMNGNHDMITADYTSLRFLKILEKEERFENTFIAECTPRIVELPGATFVLIPWAGYTTEDFAKVVEEQVAQCDPNRPIVVCGHECISSCTTDVGWIAKGNNYMRILEHPDVMFYCFGDIHKAQKLGKKSWYCGSPIQHDFGDKPGKGVLIFDTNKTSPSFHKLHGIKQLLTLNGMPDNMDEIPDAYIRLKGDKVDRLHTKLPENVLYVVPQQKAIEAMMDEFGDNLLEGIEGLLARRGLSKAHQKQARELAEEIVRAVGTTDG